MAVGDTPVIHRYHTPTHTRAKWLHPQLTKWNAAPALPAFPHPHSSQRGFVPSQITLSETDDFPDPTQNLPRGVMPFSGEADFSIPAMDFWSGKYDKELAAEEGEN